MARGLFVFGKPKLTTTDLCVFQMLPGMSLGIKVSSIIEMQLDLSRRRTIAESHLSYSVWEAKRRRRTKQITNLSYGEEKENVQKEHQKKKVWTHERSSLTLQFFCHE